MQPALLFCFIAISSITPLISSQVIISDDYLKSNADQRTPTRWSQPYPLPKVSKINENISGDANEDRRETNQDKRDANKQKRDRSNIDQIQSASSYHHNSYQAPIKEYHHTSHEHHEHHESTHIKEYHPDANHHAHSPHYTHPASHHAHHYEASSAPAHHHSVPILGHMLGHVPYSHANDGHGYEHAPTISDVYRSQDSHGNYGFGYETRTIDGDHDYRHEKKIGEVTEGSYGYKTDTAHAQNTFKHVPVDSGKFP